MKGFEPISPGQIFRIKSEGRQIDNPNRFKNPQQLPIGI
jgi:hypothetical protein